MTYQLSYGIVREHPRKVIHVVRVMDASLEPVEIDAIAETIRERMLSKFGEQTADVVVVQGSGKETLRLFGEPYSVSCVRAALFHAAVRWGALPV